MTFAWIEERSEEWPIAVLCRVLEASRSGFYAWRSRDTSVAEERREELTDEVKAIHVDVKARYGSPRMHAELVDRGHGCCVNTVARIMRKAGIAAKTKRTFGSLLIRYFIGDKRFQTKIANNPDIKRIVGINLDEFRRDADNIAASEWAMIRAVSPQEAPAIAAKLQVNERLKVHTKIERIMNPDSTSEALNHYWMLQIEGKDSEARQVFAELAARGIPVP